MEEKRTVNPQVRAWAQHWAFVVLLNQTCIVGTHRDLLYFISNLICNRITAQTNRMCVFGLLLSGHHVRWIVGVPLVQMLLRQLHVSTVMAWSHFFPCRHKKKNIVVGRNILDLATCHLLSARIISSVLTALMWKIKVKDFVVGEGFYLCKCKFIYLFTWIWFLCDFIIQWFNL